MPSNWFYQTLGEIVGPLSDAALLKSIRKGAVQDDTLVRLGHDGDWQTAASVSGLLDTARRQAMEKAELAEKRRIQSELRRDNLRVSTSSLPPHCNFKIIDTIFAFDSQGKGGLFGEAGDPHKAFAGVKMSLLDQAYLLGADAVINCQFEYRFAVAGEGFAPQQAVEIFAYGTAVRILESNDE